MTNNKSNNNDRDSDVKNFELINVNRAGISYGELKQLHNISMLALSNVNLGDFKLKTILSLTLICDNNYTLPPAVNTFFIVITKNIIFFKRCVNIYDEQQLFRWGNYCICCWKAEHNSGECKNELEVMLFNEEFRSPEEIVNFLIYK
ncbi:hypothetical protein GLOIN_2v1883110 [Rhizophagus irregularis DAOM 181602=DAOM 197198]|nr:hypothetical protein RhiirB3_454724 [Rhizophagus irregularis]GET62160.1 hypothetical protein GLOIN_2v1883110 [Rhizophagus irregularis DAOM 181602=DAOM 197198]